MNERPPVEHLCAVLRTVALHGPMPSVALECWHIDGVDDAEQRDAISALHRLGYVTVVDGKVDLRGVDRTRWATMGDVEKHARAEAIESAVKCAVMSGRATELMKTDPAGAMVMLGEIALEGTRGMMAARRADKAKADGT